MSRLKGSGLCANPLEYARAYKDYADRTYGTNASKEWWKRNSHRRTQYNLKMFHNMSLQDYDNMLHKQGGRCAICRSKKNEQTRTRFEVDHCHKTNKIRGLLCGRCNKGLGLFKDNQKYLIKAAEYLWQ